MDSDCTVIGSYDEEGRLVGVNEACSASEIARRSSDDSRRTIEAVDGHRNPSSTGFFSRIFGPGGGAALGAATAGVGAPAVASAPATASVTSTAPSGASYVAGSGGAGAGSAGASTDTSDVDAESDVRATEGSKDGDPAGREKDEKDKTVPAPDGGGGNARNGAGAGLQGGSEGAEYLTAIVAMKAGEEIAVRDASSAAVRSSDSERATTPDGGSDGGPALAGGRAPKAASVVDRAGIGGWLALPLVGLSLLAGGAWAWRRQSR